MQILQRGDTGALVEMAQLALCRSGFLTEAPDGFFGKRTEAALAKFQNGFSLPPTGVLTAETWNKLNRFIKGYFTKTIARGDTVWGLAARYGTTAEAIRAANPAAVPNALQPGQKLTVPFGFAVTPDDISYSYELVALIAEGLKARYPMLQVGDFGKSAMGKHLPLLTVGRGEKTLFISACFHANEWLNVPAALSFTEDYLWAYVHGRAVAGQDAAAFFERTKLCIAPLVNPDGLDLVTGALKTGPAFENALKIAQAYPAIPFPDGWKANIEGTDLNLQFPAGWDKARDVKFAQGFVSPAPRDYVGNAPLSAPEAKAVYDLTNSSDFRMIVALHSQGEVIYWKYLDFLPPQSARVGRILSEASGYPLEITPEASSYAGYKDWFIAQFNRPGYTAETGSGTNPLPLSQFERVYKAVKPMLAAALRETASL